MKRYLIVFFLFLGVILLSANTQADNVTKEWLDAGFISYEASGWMIDGFSLEEAIKWRDAGFSHGSAKLWKKRGFTPEEAKGWKALGIKSSKKAKKLVSAGISMEEYKKYKEEGISDISEMIRLHGDKN